MTEAVENKEVQTRTSQRKVRIGVVSSDKMDKTITVKVFGRKPHPLYGKPIPYSKKYAAHDEKNEAQEGDTVEIMETRPLSKSKRWRLVKVIQKRK